MQCYSVNKVRMQCKCSATEQIQYECSAKTVQNTVQITTLTLQYILFTTNCQMPSKYYFKFDNLGHDHVVEKPDLRNLIANIKWHKSRKEYFCASSYQLRDMNILNFLP